MIAARIAAATLLCASFSAAAADSIDATQRANAENYKDRALAACISTAYKGTSAGNDADVDLPLHDRTRGHASVGEVVRWRNVRLHCSATGRWNKDDNNPR